MAIFGVKSAVKYLHTITNCALLTRYKVANINCISFSMYLFHECSALDVSLNMLVITVGQKDLRAIEIILSDLGAWKGCSRC